MIVSSTTSTSPITYVAAVAEAVLPQVEPQGIAVTTVKAPEPTSRGETRKQLGKKEENRQEPRSEAPRTSSSGTKSSQGDVPPTNSDAVSSAVEFLLLQASASQDGTPGDEGAQDQDASGQSTDSEAQAAGNRAPSSKESDSQETSKVDPQAREKARQEEERKAKARAEAYRQQLVHQQNVSKALEESQRSINRVLEAQSAILVIGKHANVSA